ncbi:molybdopterin-synthase adenylyltransferase MoeB [Ningiella sp. W23]|uniref:molybdopterin-synthase adenylyltransferase MoeB n=1 Tax=Ningiella sp. W23 TaxID=3023715 RepID=UPI0037562DF5
MTTKTLSTAEAMRYSRQILLSGFDLEKQELLINSSVLMIGAGGLGCAAAQYLVAAGIGKLTLVDDDTVENTNLQRQVLHFEDDIGAKKVDSALATLSQINHYTELVGIDKRLSETELEPLVDTHNLVVDCTDNLQSRNTLNDLCYRNNTPLVSGAAIRMEGQIFCVIPTLNSACYRCVSHYFGEQNLSCVESGVMSPVVGIIGASQANEAIKILTQFGQAPINCLQIFDAAQSQWDSVRVNALKTCPTCANPHE